MFRGTRWLAFYTRAGIFSRGLAETSWKPAETCRQRLQLFAGSGPPEFVFWVLDYAVCTITHFEVVCVCQRVVVG